MSATFIRILPKKKKKNPIIKLMIPHLIKRVNIIIKTNNTIKFYKSTSHK